MRLLRSASFFKPAKAILVPGMYFLGFSGRDVRHCSQAMQGHNDNVRSSQAFRLANRVFG